MRAIVMAVTALSLTAASAAAQPVQTFADLPLRLNAGDTVIVHDAAGAETRGKLVTVGPESMTLRTGSAIRTFAQADVRQVDLRGDSLHNGIFYGAVIGVGLGCVFGASFAEMWRWNDCPAGAILFGPVIMGASIMFDALHVGTHTVFTTPERAAWLPDDRRMGVKVVWAW